MKIQRGIGRTFRASWFIVAIATTLALGQTAEKPVDRWLNRARLLTDDLLKDEESLSGFDRALLWARLGAAWRQDDQERAKVWMHKAVEEVTITPEQETREKAEERARRLATARAMLSIIGSSDQALDARLLKVLSSESTDRDSIKFGGGKATELGQAALSAVDSDPQQAVDLGMASLRTGGATQLASLLWKLQRLDTQKGEALFRAVLAVARERNYDLTLLSLLTRVAFEGPAPSEALGTEFLSVLSDGLLRVPRSESEKARICWMAAVAAPLLPEFQRLLPQRTGAVRAALAECRAQIGSSASKNADDALNDRSPKTIDDLLKASKETSDLRQRTSYLFRSADLAAQKGDYDRATEILGGFSKEEREMDGHIWENLYWTDASLAAIAHLKRGDFNAMNRVLSALPAHLLPKAQSMVVDEMIKEGRTSLARELMDQARAGFNKSDSIDAVMPWYMGLLHRYTLLDPAEALLVLNELVTTLNRLEGVPPSKKSVDPETKTPLLSANALVGRYSLPVTLLETDETGMRLAVSSMTSPVRRVAMRLNLLNAALGQRRKAVAAPNAESKGKSDASK